jgi:hypothetical protein
MASKRGDMMRGALRYPCKTCGAKRGEPCRSKAGLPTAEPHVNRQYAYMRNTGTLQPDAKDREHE